MPKPAPPRVPAPTNPPVPGSAVSKDAGGGPPAQDRDRIISAINLIVDSLATPTPVCNVLCEYYRHVGGRLSFPNFPVTLHDHPRTPWNADRPFETVWAGLVHHVGAAIKAYQQYRVLADQGKETDKHVLAVNNARIQLEEMIDRLEIIVKAGVPRLVFAGNIVTGFFLALA